MPRNKRPHQVKRVDGASSGKRKRAIVSPSAAPHHHTPRAQNAESTPASPKSIEDVARLFIGVNSSSSCGKAYENTERASVQLKKAKGSTKRLREDVENDTVGKRLPMKRHKSPTIGVLSSTATITTMTERKTRRPPKAAGRNEDDDDDDVELAKAVQAQTLSFLQRLSSKSSTAFWGLRDVAQGKRCTAAATAATATSSLSSSSSPSSKKAAKSSAKGTRKLLDDGKELWRVGGPYIPCYQDGDSDGGERESGHTSGSESKSSTSSSEPSWVTDSSEDMDDGSNDDGNYAEKSSPVATGASSRRGVAGARKQSGGGCLFQGGDDGVWDDD
ncbi:hypothetical protein LPMP_354280 [Leishmania panamensis]|uniref:Uncharacterized protein n=1 Tax=Leishmania panamensis TaxID=5679 RepID=A0A088S2X2_LEIPA|nr:hypothetical protein LPMP_354280 [Leishmania panamensis]AIO02561.1 hypothetical protein LPMP_354280 [Leishmania panamensis]